MTQAPSAKEQLTAHFDKSATAVRVYADQFEKSYARPALKTATSFLEENPISAAFLATFTFLAFFPVLTFLTLSLFTVASFSFLALCSAFIASSAVVLLFLSILVLVLVATFFASAFFTVLGLCTYLALRFVQLVVANGHHGLSIWALETKDRFVLSSKREASDSSAVVVDVKEAPSEWTTDDSFGSNADAKQEGS
ncbi:hypothetical protein B0H17DRAFT_1193637 [Mycena rosella]|uniref:Uncharacterized protein n=1 Tax=Mycena rosella TaxID=1033263 RepID=A0AAD7M731_MYCRO|nr:hypothetical protein B0H17DRAFT_1193637 [Mycena rosella]